MRTFTVVNSQTELHEWIERCTDQPAIWLVVRLVNCKFAWLTPQGEWSRKQRDAAAFRERETAYGDAREHGGLIYLYDRA